MLPGLSCPVGAVSYREPHGADLGSPPFPNHRGPQSACNGNRNNNDQPTRSAELLLFLGIFCQGSLFLFNTVALVSCISLALKQYNFSSLLMPLSLYHNLTKQSSR